MTRPTRKNFMASLSLGLALTAAPLANAQTTSLAQPAAKSKASQFEGYDFGHVVQRMENSVDPLQKEMNASFKVFVDKVVEAEALMEEGKVEEAVQGVVSAIHGVLTVRDQVLAPMWQGQDFLNQQIGRVRSRLARAVSASNGGRDVKLSQRTEQMLDKLALKIASEKDPIRQKRLTSHYRAVRNLAQIKSMTVQLSPDQRKLWMNILRVLEEASLAHEQVTLGTEVLFAQFEATATNLQEYVTTLDALNGASQLLGVVRGRDGQGSGMSEFARSMGELQKRLQGFNGAVEEVLEKSMTELESQIDAIQPEDDDINAGVISNQADDELQERIRRIQEKDGASR